MACLKSSAVLMLLVAGLLDLNPTVAGSIERSSEYSLRDASDGLVSIDVDEIEPSLSSSTRHGKCKRKRVNNTPIKSDGDLHIPVRWSVHFSLSAATKC